VKILKKIQGVRRRRSMGATSVYRPLNFRALPDTVPESCELTCAK
jgi:hypothetical protein